MYKKIFITSLIILFSTSLIGCLPTKTTKIVTVPKAPQTIEEKIDYAGKTFYQKCIEQNGSQVKCIDYAKTATKQSIDQSGYKNSFLDDCLQKKEPELTCKARANVEMGKIYQKIEEQLSKLQ